MRFCRSEGSPSKLSTEGPYGPRIWIDIDSSAENFADVLDYLNDISVWGKCDKRCWKYDNSDMRRYEEDSTCARSWEFEEETIEDAIKYFNMLCWTEDLPLEEYKYEV